MEVTFYEEAPDASCTTVTPKCSKGALGTWRPQCSPRTLSRGSNCTRSGGEFMGKPAWAGRMHVSA